MFGLLKKAVARVRLYLLEEVTEMMLDPTPAPTNADLHLVPEDLLAPLEEDLPAEPSSPQEICEQVWRQLCLSQNEDSQRVHFMTLSLFHKEIATGPEDPRWGAFVSSLPGFRGFLDNITGGEYE
jgi:hypothetical protein